MLGGVRHDPIGARVVTAHGARDAKLAVCERHRARAVDVDPGAFATTVLVAPAYCVPCRDERDEHWRKKDAGAVRSAMRLAIARELLVAAQPVDAIVQGMRVPVETNAAAGCADVSLAAGRHASGVIARASVMLADALLAELDKRRPELVCKDLTCWNDGVHTPHESGELP